LQLNVTPPPSTTNISEGDDVYGASKCISLVINKASSIEEETSESIEMIGFQIKQQLPQPTLTKTIELPSDDEKSEILVANVIEEVPINLDIERKASVSAEQRQKSMEQQEVSIELPSFLLPRPSITSLPASISTQTIPTEDFPEASTLINQTAAQCNIDTTGASEKEKIRKGKSRSIEEKEEEGKVTSDVESNKSVEVEVDNFVDQQRHHHHHHHHRASDSLVHQQSQASQDEDYEITMVGLLPGCVGE
jgi:hypothetical protein